VPIIPVAPAQAPAPRFLQLASFPPGTTGKPALICSRSG